MPAVSVILIGIAAALLADLAVRLFFARYILRHFERKIPFAVEKFPPHPAAEPISFPTTGGLTLRGSLYCPGVRSPRGLVVFCPEAEGNHWSAMNYAQGLVDTGYVVLSFDFRNQGESDSLPGYEPMHWVTRHEVDDLKAALQYVRAREDLAALPLGLFGISRGGGTALAVATRDPGIGAVVCEGAYSTETLMLHYVLRWASLYIPGWLMRCLPIWHIRGTLALVRRLSGWRRKVRHVTIERRLHRLADRPVLFIAGGRDTYVAPQISAVLAQKVNPAADLLWVVEAAKHNQARSVDPAGYDERLLALFSRLGHPNQDRFPRLLHVA